ncbi:MAG TPA: ankyrin repeat domain-containing protein [Flavobacterium sp.]|jgi:ankyrin repeat protein
MKKTIITLGMALLCLTTSTAATGSGNYPSELTFVNPRTTTPLCVAISKGDTDFVKKMIDYGADVNEKSNGRTPLMIAATYNRVEIIEYLLSKGADIKAKNENGFTALKYAEISNAKESIDLLSSYTK